jgi:phage gpG-like protein
LVNEGDLWNSINEQAFSDHVVIGSAKHYAAIHQLGGETGPRTIRPKNKKALFWPGAGHPMKAVRHPGSTIPARPFLPDEQSLDWDEIHDTVTRYLLP